MATSGHEVTRQEGDISNGRTILLQKQGDGLNWCISSSSANQRLQSMTASYEWKIGAKAGRPKRDVKQRKENKGEAGQWKHDKKKD